MNPYKSKGRVMTNIKVASTTLFIVLALILIIASPVSAGLSVSGAKIVKSVSPGEVTTYVMNVGNTGAEPIDIAVEVRGLGNNIMGPTQALTAENDLSPYTARSFITAIPTSFRLEPGQSQDITITVNVPSGIGDSGRYADIFIRTIPSEGSQIATSAAVSAQVLLTIEGTTPTISGDITSIDIPQAVSEQLFSATATIQNTGNYHYKIRYNGTVKNNQDQIVGTAWQTDSVYNLIPTFSKQIDIPLNISQELTPGTYSLEIEAYTQDGILLDTGSKTFVLTDLYKPMLLRPLLVEFWDTGKLSMYQWDMSEDGTLMENVDATSLASSVNLLIRQGTKVLWSEGQSTNNIAVTLVDPSPPPGYDIVRAFDFSPDGITFDPKAYITFEYSPADVPEGVSEMLLRVATFDEDTLQWIILEGDDVEVDTDANTITFPVKHFSVYAIVAPPPASPTTIAGIDKQTWIWIGIGALWVVVLTFAIGMIQRRRGQTSRKDKNRRRRGRGSRPQASNDEW